MSAKQLAARGLTVHLLLSGRNRYNKMKRRRFVGTVRIIVADVSDGFILLLVENSR